MRLDFNPDQQALLDAVERIALDYETRTTLGAHPYETSAALQADLDGAGVFEAVALDGLGPVAAAAMVHRLARLPQCLELVATALVLPKLAPRVPSPCAVLWEDRGRPARWLPGARAVLCVRDGAVETASLADADVQPIDSPFGYPVGRLKAPDALAWQALDVDSAAPPVAAGRRGRAGRLPRRGPGSRGRPRARPQAVRPRARVRRHDKRTPGTRIAANSSATLTGSISIPSERPEQAQTYQDRAYTDRRHRTSIDPQEPK